MPTILESWSQEEIVHPFELDATLVAPNIVSDATEANSQADTADLSMQSPSHKPGSTSMCFMPAFSATSSSAEVCSEQINQNSDKLLQKSRKLSCK